MSGVDVQSVACIPKDGMFSNPRFRPTQGSGLLTWNALRTYQNEPPRNRHSNAHRLHRSLCALGRETIATTDNAAAVGTMGSLVPTSRPILRKARRRGQSAPRAFTTKATAANTNARPIRSTLAVPAWL